MSSWSHHRIPTCAPGFLSDSSHRYISDRVVMYCATVFCRCLMYYSIIWNPASSFAVSAKVYYHFLSVFCCRICLVSRCATWSWKPPRTLPMRGVTTQVSDPNSSTACTTDLRKNTDTRGSALYLLMILVIIFHTALSRDKFLTTAGQSSSASKITRPRHRKEVTISRGCP